MNVYELLQFTCTVSYAEIIFRLDSNFDLGNMTSYRGPTALWRFSANLRANRLLDRNQDP